MKTAIILGSSRSHGNTGQLANHVKRKLNGDYYDLSNYDIEPFNYNNHYQDDFKTLITALINYDQLIFASPMYWYCASGQMKIFLDRLSDLLSFHKEKGRALRGKSVALLATGGDKQPPECFEQMFKLTFHYLGMDYKGMNYCSCPDEFNLSEHQSSINEFIEKL